MRCQMDPASRIERLLRMGILQEPLGYVDGANAFEYVGSNPVNERDCLGLWKMGNWPTIVVEAGDVPGKIARDMTGDFENWSLVFPDLDDPTKLQIGVHTVDEEILREYLSRSGGNQPPATRPSPPTTRSSPPVTLPALPTKQPSGPTTRPTTQANTKMMWVTAYSDPGLGSSGQRMGPNSVAVADTLWRKTPGTGRGIGEHRDLTGRTSKAAVPAYPYGSTVIVSKDGKVIYTGTVKDTGRGHIRNGFPSDRWIDIWLPTRGEAITFGKQELCVEIKPPGK